MRLRSRTQTLGRKSCMGCLHESHEHAVDSRLASFSLCLVIVLFWSLSGYVWNNIRQALNIPWYARERLLLVQERDPRDNQSPLHLAIPCCRDAPSRNSIAIPHLLLNNFSLPSTHFIIDIHSDIHRDIHRGITRLPTNISNR